MSPSEVLDIVNGLTRDQLSYYSRMGYVNTKKVRKGKNDYNEYTPKEVAILKKAYYKIDRHGTSPKRAFEKARKEIRDQKKQ